MKDTVRPYEAWRDSGTGFTFANYSSADMLHVIREAVYLYKDYPDAFARLRQRAMEQDFSWNRSAGEYLKIYAAVTGLSLEKKSARPAAADMTDAPTASGSASASEADEKPVRPVKKAAAGKSAGKGAKKPVSGKKSAGKTAPAKPKKKGTAGKAAK